MALEYSFSILDNFGIIEILIFMLVFVIVFAILQKVKILGDQVKDPKVKSYNLIVALVMGLLVIFPHVLYGDPSHQTPQLSNGFPDVVNIIAQALPNVSMVVVAIIMALLIIGVMGKRFELGGTTLSGWIALGAFALVLFIFGAAAQWWNMPNFLYFVLANPDLLALVVVILVFAIVIHFITKEDKPEPNENSLARQLDKMLK